MRKKDVRMSKEVVEQTKKLFQIYKLGGVSVRTLAERFDIPWTTLRDRFRSQYGKQYTKHRADEGTVHAVIKEHLSRLEGIHLRRAAEWYRKNQAELLMQALEDQMNPGLRPKVYTERRMDSDTKAMCRLNHDVGSSPYLSDGRYEPKIDGEDSDEPLPSDFWD
jgi:hypothetical protein